jgi:hypothetical protein
MNRTYKNLIAALFLFIGTIAHAQTPGFDDDVQDVPIDNWIVPMFVLAAVVLFFVVRKKQTN